MKKKTKPKKKKDEEEKDVDQEAWETEDHRRTAEIAEEVLKKHNLL